MRPQPQLWLRALARLAAFIGLALILGVVVALPIVWLAPSFVTSMWFDVGSTSIAALAAGAILIRFADHRPVAALGIGFSRATPRHFAIGTVIGAAGLILAAFALFATATLRYAPDNGTLLQWASTVVSDLGFFTVAALAEEAVFRGYPFQVLVYAAGAPAAVILTSIGFALAHIANPDVSAFALINIALAGVLLAVAYLRTLSLWFATALHMGWNWTMATLFDLPVSGIATFDTPLYEPVVGGAAWWSGGSFGPEGGVVGALGFGVAILLLWRWRAVQPDARIAAAGPLVILSPALPGAVEMVENG